MAASETKVFRPRSLGGLLRLFARNPDAMLYAGGTEIVPRCQRGPGRSLELPEKVIYLGAVPELARISRSQRFLDIGVCLSVSRILSMGRNVLPLVLYKSLAGIGTPSIRNLVTLGGNLCSSASRGDSQAALAVIDAQVELRSVGGIRWLGAAQFLSRPLRPHLEPGEIITRVRVPLEDWDAQYFRKVSLGVSGSHGSLCVAAVAHFPKGSIEALQLCISAADLPLFRRQGFESRFKGLRLPIPAKELETLIGGLWESLGETRPGGGPSAYVRATAARMARSFLLELNTRGLEDR